MKFVIPDTIPRAALITGGGHRHGQTIGRALAEAGFRIAFQCDPGQTASDLTLIADLSDETQAAALPARATAAIGPIGVLVNAASVTQGDSWDTQDAGAWNAHMHTNLRAPFILIQRFALALPPDREGVAINLLDNGAASMATGHLSYSVSKAALWSLTQTMALALAPRIRVNGIGQGNSRGDAREQDREIGRAALAILAFRSMTGQMISPGGVRPPDA